MIQMHQLDTDDPEFMSAVANSLECLARETACRRFLVVHIDNWFDHKWLCFAGQVLGAVGAWRDSPRLTIPAFHPNRVLAETCYERGGIDGTLQAVPSPTRLHVEQASAANLQRRIHRVAPEAALLWYSGNTAGTQRGSLMVYVPLTTIDYACWYASFIKRGSWAVAKTKGVSPDAVGQYISLGA